MSNRFDLRVDKLPYDIYNFYLFQYLDINEILNLKYVSGQFLTIVNQYFIKELTFIDKQVQSIYGKEIWFSTNKSYKLSSMIGDDKLFLLNSLPNLKFLKFLKIHTLKHSIDLNKLNKFTNLQILEINQHYLYDDNQILQLPDLKGLSLELREIKKKNNLEIVAPKLHSLFFDSYLELNQLGQIIFNHPLSIKFIGIHFYEAVVTRFTNLECLEINYVHFNKHGLDFSGLLELRNLKKLKLRSAFTIDKLKNFFGLKRDELEVYLAGVRIESLKKLNEYDLLSDDLKFQLDNYEENFFLEDNLNFVNRFEYTHLTKLLPDNEPANLFRKFTNIQRIFISYRVKDEDRLINFIKKCHNLLSLNIRDSNLSQQFYDRLPAACQLVDLNLQERLINLNFEFINRIPTLRFLVTNQKLSDKNLNFNRLVYSDFR